jgi:hypothetical protein
MKNTWIKLGGAAAVALAAAANVQAIPSAPTFEYSTDGSTFVTSGSSIANVNYNGWAIHNIGGALVGTAMNPIMDLDSLDVSGVGTLYILMSVTGLGPTTAVLTAHLGGNLSGSDSVAWSGYTSGANTLFGTTTTLFSIPGLTGAVNASASGFINYPSATNNYSMTEEYVITSVGGNIDSLDGTMNTVPDGGLTVMLLGVGLSGLALLRKRLIA